MLGIKFIQMTKPVKFRGLKMLLNKGKALSSVIKYNIFNILSKLHILNRYIYRDKGVEEILLPPYRVVNVLSSLCTGTIKLKLLKGHYYDIDQFKSKKGKILLSVSDTEEITYTLNAHLDYIMVNIDCQLFSAKTPIKVNILPPKPFGEFTKGVIEMPEYKTVTLNLDKLHSLRKQYVVSDTLIDDGTIPNEVLDFYLESAKEEFESYLKEMKLKDLEM